MHLADIEELNNAAARSRVRADQGELRRDPVLDGSLPHSCRRAARSDAAAARCWWRVPRRSPPLFADFARKRIAIPGERTTAYMLLQLALGTRPKHVQMRFDRIIRRGRER